ncbi:MAG: hypothetical protein JXO51_03965 [Candidatus Aminicenantes bacterium]|nr:hypothetical protein [Candidatus Aminicenantes bacterium]
MVNRRRLSSFLLALALFLPAAAADYLFKVNDLQAELTVQPDGKVRIRYGVTFTPQPGSHPVDIVDIGMPNDSYDLGSARAWIAGRELADIRRSEFVKPGVEVHLGSAAIAPGRSGTLEFEIAVERLLYADSEDPLYASLQFKTTWYDRRYVEGNAERIEVLFHLPPGSRPEEVKYHDFGGAAYRPSEMALEGDHVVYRWVWLDRPATVPYAAGASFRRDLVARVASPRGGSVLRTLGTVANAFAAFVLALAPVWIIVLIIVLAVRSQRKRLQQYLPPRVGIESGGIKRGLSPAQAALLQELPLVRVLLLVVFGLLKKGLVAIKEVAPGDMRFHALKSDGPDLHEYEADFLAAIDKDNRLVKAKLRAMFTAMIADVQVKMAGFSRRETNAYYQSIMNRAWEQVKACPREKLPEELARSLEWLVLDGEYETKLEPYAGEPVFAPASTVQWYRHIPHRGAGPPAGGLGRTVSGTAANLVHSLQAFSGALLGESAAFTAAITKVTNPPPVRSTSSGHGSGGGCACACACAGCACACAGGGR